MGKWLISFPVEGYLYEKEEYRVSGNVIFHVHTDEDSRYGTRLLGSIILDQSNDRVATDKAQELIDDALTELTFTSGESLKLGDGDFYVTPKDEFDTDISFNKRTIHRMAGHYTIAYRIGEDDTDDILLKIYNLKLEKKNPFRIAIGYYRLAVESNNPYVALSNYFSSISTIVRDLTGYQEIRQGNLKGHMRAIVGSDPHFDRKFKDYYKRGRSASTHGHIDAMDKNEIRDARKSSFGMKIWSRRILVDYINQNQDSKANKT